MKKSALPILPKPYIHIQTIFNGKNFILIGESEEMIGLFYWDGYSVGINNEEITRKVIFALE